MKFNTLPKIVNRLFGNTWISGILIVVGTTLITVGLIGKVAIVELAENHLSDIRIALLSDPRPQSQKIAVILIDEKSLNAVPYRSPIDRALIADLIEELEHRGVTAIGLNVRFDRSTEPAKDARLFDKLRNIEVPVVVSMVSDQTGYSKEQIEYSKQYLQGLDTGLSLIFRDTIDHTVRASLLRLSRDETVKLGFTATLTEAIGIELPLEDQIYIDYRLGPDSWTPPFPVYPAFEVAALPKSALENRVVLIGPDLGHTRRLRTPFSVLNRGFSKDMPGVMIEAHVLSQLIENRVLDRATFPESVFFTILMAALGFLLSLIRVNLISKILIPIAVLPFAWTGALLLFILNAALIPMITPTIAFVLAIILTSFWQWRVEALRREKVHQVFGRYLAPTVVDQILENADEPELSGEVREVSFLFTDLEGFTRLTETTQPQIMVGLVNNYLEEACDIVIANGGTIDKIVGDALHVMFNAPVLQPDHARRAVRCALALDRWSEEFRHRFKQQGIDLGVTRIGVNTGNCIVGNFGGKKRFDYTAHGDAINTAARLEAINQRLGTKICVSESTVNQCQGLYFRSVATLVLRGKSAGIKTYTPLGFEKARNTKLIMYELAYQLLSDDDPKSDILFGELASHYPDDPLIALHFNRIRDGERSTTLVIRKK